MQEQGFTYILQTLIQAPLWVQLLIIIVIAPAYYLTFKIIKDRDFRKDIIGFFKGIKKDTIVHLENHELFMYKTIAKNYISRLDMGSNLKNTVFKIILNYKVDVVIRLSKEFLDNTKDEKFDISVEMNKYIEHMINIYEAEITTALMKNCKPLADELYRVIYEEAFAIKHADNITFLLKSIGAINHSMISDNQKIYMYFNMIYIALDLAIVDCERSFKSLNGKLNKYEAEEPCE